MNLNNIWCIFLVIVGCLMVIKPEIIWRIEHMLLSKDEKPNDTYLKISRIGGIFIIIIGIYRTFFG